MINNPITTQDLFLAQVESEYTTKEQVILQYIREHDTIKAEEGTRYYYNENDIVDRKISYYDKNGVKQVDDDATNHKDSNNFHKILVDQKTLYLFGRDMTVTYNEEDNLQDDINELIDFKKLNNNLNELCVESSNKGVEYLHPNVNEEGEFEYTIMPAEQVIPIYDMATQKKMEAFIRYYNIWINEEQTLRVEYWDKETVSYYILSAGTLIPDPIFDEGENVKPHFTNSTGEAMDWGKVPLVEFKNNSKRVYDLQFYKGLIDSYDRNMSDLDNNLDEIQEVILAISGAAATPAAELKANFKYHKIIKVDGPNSSVDKIEIQIPVKATVEMMDRLERNVFMFGQGINVLTDNMGNKSGEALKFLYQILDLKANKTDRMFTEALSEFFYFVVMYINNTKNKDYDHTTIDFKFNRTLITNDKEKSEIAKNSVNILDLETILKNHPWVRAEDVSEIIDKVESERGTNRL